MHVDATMIICGALVYGVFVCEGVRVSLCLCVWKVRRSTFLSLYCAYQLPYCFCEYHSTVGVDHVRRSTL